MSNNFDDFSPNPYAATSTAGATPLPTGNRSYGGIGRLAYVGYSFLALMVYYVALFGIGAAGQAAGDAIALAIIPVMLVYFGVSFWIVALRMINTGYSAWWCIGMIIPILNILVGIRCLVCPEGYADHRTLDTPGKVIVGLILGFFALGILLVVIAAIGSA